MAAWARLSFHEALELPCDLFLACYRGWYIDRLMESEEGREYLKDCERLKKTQADNQGIRDLMDQIGGKA